MKLKNLAGAFVVLAGLAFGNVAAAGNIYEIRPVDEDGNAIAAPTEPIGAGSTVYFVVRLAAPAVNGAPGNPLLLVHNPLCYNTAEIDWATGNRPGIGIYVNGKLVIARLVKTPTVTHDSKGMLSDFIFSYTVKAGDFALPIRLANEDGSVVTEQSESVRFYFDPCMVVDRKGNVSPTWFVDDSTETTPKTADADFQYIPSSGPGYPGLKPPESDGRRIDYDLSGCNFNVRTVDFDDPATPYTENFWRTVPDGDIGCWDVTAPRLVLTGLPTDSVKLYLWSDDDTVAYLADGKPQTINVTATETKTCRVLEIDTVKDYRYDLGGYEIRLAGAAGKKGKTANIILSGFTNFNYRTGAVEKLRVPDYLSRPVIVGEKMPARVTVKPSSSSVTATADYTNPVTELQVSFNRAFTEDVVIEIIPGFREPSYAGKWQDYLRFGAVNGQDLTYETPATNMFVCIPAGSTVPSKFVNADGTDGDAITGGRIYVYALRSDGHTRQPNGGLTFRVDTTNATARAGAAGGGYDGWNTVQGGLTVDGVNPVIEQPAEGDDTMSASVGEDDPLTLTISVSDVYADITCTNGGYTIEYMRDREDNTWQTLPGLWRPGEGNVLYSTNETAALPQVAFSMPSRADEKTKLVFRVVSPVSGKRSADRTVYVKVSPQKEVGIVATDGKPNNIYDEGEEVNFRITVDNADGKATGLYAFLEPQGDVSSNQLSCAFLAAPGNQGCYIGSSGTYEGSFTLLDGGPGASGTEFNFKVVLCSTQTYAEDKKQTSYVCANELRIHSKNKIPEVKYIMLGSIDESGEFSSFERIPYKDGSTRFRTKLALGVTNYFQAVVEDPGEYDKTNTNKPFEVRWTVNEEGRNPYAITMKGDPDFCVMTNAFRKSGVATVTVQLKDKDMNQYGNRELYEEFEFEVEVIDAPQVKLTGLTYFTEDAGQSDPFDGEGELELSLDLNKSDYPLTVELAFEPAAGSVEPYGSIVLNAPNKVDEDGHTVSNVYLIVFEDGATSVTVPILKLDGTSSSKSYGFTVTGTMTNPYPEGDSRNIAPDSGGKTFAEYYVSSPKAVKIENVPPRFEDLSPLPNTCTDSGVTVSTNTITTSASELSENRITWTFNDVSLDFARGIKVEARGGVNTLTTNFTSYAEAQQFGSKIGYVPDFSGLKGTQTVTLTITDPDGKPIKATWTFELEQTKPMRIIAHGPSAGNGTANSKRYRAASGIGAGRVFAEGKFTSAKTFEFAYDFDNKLSTAKVYGYGYKVGDHYESTASGGRFVTDTARWRFADPQNAHWIYSNGYSSDASGVTTPFAYEPARDKNGQEVDSFLYTWLSLTRSADNGSLTDAIMGNAFSPEYTELANSGTLAGLVDPHTPTGGNSQNNSAALIYDDTLLEAIFSREYLATDNMGDINQDGIPDIYVDKYGFGVVDLTTGILVEDGKDLDSLAAYNGDLESGTDGNTGNEGGTGDYLPGDATVYAGVSIAGGKSTWTRKFTADLEIRGFGEGLNDAPFVKATFGPGLTGVKPDQVYEDPDLSPTSTLSKVEFLAWSEFKAAYEAKNGEGTATVEMWSPERPTDPTKTDTDGDGLEDGFEYYYWYLAHVGYIDANGIHRYLTGRRYNPRNPGEGDLITREKIEETCDPLEKYTGSDADTLDSDYDGLPDLLEFEIGTNPFDFDSDGDGLPDGWEVMISGTDPCKVFTSGNLSDAMRNYDGDAMAFTTPALEALQLPLPLKIDVPFSFALVKPDGDTDGIQWYVGKAEPTGIGVLKDEQPGTSFTVGGVTYVTRLPVSVVTNVTAGLLSSTTNVVIAADLPKEATWTTTNAAPDGVEVTAGLIALMPTRIPAGTPIDPETEVVAGTYATLQFANGVTGANAAWVYGRETISMATSGDGLANLGGFGMLAIGRYQDAPKDLQIAALPKADESVAYLHYLVYQEFGFDPRTAWNANTPLAPRWGTSDGAGGGKANNISYNSSGYAGVATRTREYTAYDEFLVYSFFLNNGMVETYAEVLDDKAPILAEIWYANTTNPRGPGEKVDTDGVDADGEAAKYWGRDSDNGADTDDDGVPDGWELYVMAGPKANGKYHFAFPYNDGYYSSFGPFSPDASDTSLTDNLATGANDSSGGDGDGLTELQEFAGTDSCAWYSRPQKGNEKAFSTTIVRPEEHRNWMNKFFPSDPWNQDTDKDGITDGYEIKTWTFVGGVCEFRCGNFLYGTPVDDGKSTSIPGGGLNPLSVDTDGDGLPDAWEAQFAGSKIYDGEGAEAMTGLDGDGKAGTEGNPKQGLCDGMDGTVADAFNYPVRVTRIVDADGSVSNVVLKTNSGFTQVVNRDYDFDGLDNWQEYMTGLMRCWRYDDPKSSWGYIPDDWYWNENGLFEPKLEKFGFSSMDEFWTETLLNTDGRFYNPHLVTGMSPANYMSCVKNGWDPVYRDEGSYYWIYDRIGDALLADLWGHAPLGYASCSPIDSDSDQDGMDDYYELFHGLNPLLGLSGKEATSGADDGMFEKRGPCDLIHSAYVGSTEIEAWSASGYGNFWQSNPGLKEKSRSKVAGGYDFIVYPWLNGLQMADPDGDDIRNVNEAIMPKLATETWNHTDPSPLWMTDSSYSNSLVRLFFRMPTRFGVITLNHYGSDLEPCFKNTLDEGKIRYFREFDGFRPREGPARPPRFLEYKPDFWSLAADGKANWMFSFEENEGYDTDHDGIGDYEEGQGKYRSATDMQDFDSPRRRQAMYFPGKDAALQTPPLEIAHHPVDDTLKSEPEFLTYTVECWVLPEDDTRDQVILERAIWTDFSKPGDEEFMRKNFQLAIRKGKWYTKFDPNGTLANNAVEIYATTKLEVGKWTHLAATFDGDTLNFYVNGIAQVAKTGLALQPEHGESVLAVRTEYGFGYGIGDYWFDRKYGYQAIVVGASVRGRTETGADGRPVVKNERGYLALDLSRGIGWEAYTDFFKGYVDEIRIWDGARDFEDIYGDYAGAVNCTRRYTRETAIDNRSAVYKDWSTGKRRAVRGDTLEPELRYHWSFDSLFAADNTKAVAKVPHGFDIDYGAAYLSRPAGYTVDWWRKIVEGDAGTAGYGSVYAGKFDWVAWIPNTVAHLPFYDGTTLDSQLWSESYCGNRAGAFTFPRTAEPVSRWTQMIYNGIGTTLGYQTTGTRHRFVNDMAARTNSTLAVQFEFTNRNLDLCGADLLPLGGAFARYLPDEPGLWDGQGASSMWEQTQTDADNNGIPDWWDVYADQNYRLKGTDSGTRIDWDETVDYHGIPMSAGEAYLRDLAKGYYLDAYGTMHPLDPEVQDWTEMRQTAKSDGKIPDWWKSLYKIDDCEPLSDTDNDGLNNYVEYVASELLPFRLVLDPKMARTDTATLDYFRKVGKLYVGEMLTDHDQMEDHWERSLGNESIASAALWDALKDAEEDGWNNFAENRYNGYAMANLAQLVAHAMGEEEVLDLPTPSLKMKVRYNGDSPLASVSEDDEKKDETGSVTMPPIVVRAYSKSAETGGYAMNPDAIWKVEPGKETAEKSVYLGCWEDRVVRGTMAPGNINLDSVNVWFAQILQSDLYSWTDEGGTHIARPYAEFIEALERNPDIVQNVQRGNSSESGDAFWKEFATYSNPYGAADVRAVVVARDALTQKGVIAVYGERVGTIDLSTGDFEFDLGAMNRLQGVEGTSEGDRGDMWSFKEAIFKITYTAKVPSAQQEVVDFSLAKADRGFVRGGLNSIEAFYDLDGNGVYTPGEPFGVLNDVEIGWSGRTLELELTDMSAITPRIDLWSAATDRAALTAADGQTNISFAAVASAPAKQCRVSVVRHRFNGESPYDCGIVDNAVVYEGDVTSDARTFLHEGDFLASGPDIDWDHLYADAVADEGSYLLIGALTNVTYLVTFDGQIGANPQGADTTALSAVITRRFEVQRRKPTPCLERMVFNRARPTFAWTIEGEDPWAAKFGTTYTAFKVRVRTLSGALVYESDVTRMPAKDSYGVYTWTAPLYVGARTAQGVEFGNLTDYTWEIALYNAKFSTDTVMSSDINGVVNGNPFSERQTFRMNVTQQDLSSCSIAVAVSYAGPATQLAGKIRVQAFESPDFTGDPAAEKTVGSANATVVLDGLVEGDYFIRAYIDTNGNGVHDEWESWGYLCERDLANKAGIFNPVIARSRFDADEGNVRTVHIEDCDTDGDWFPDVWEAEQNGGVFEAFKSGKGQGPVTGNAELIGVNPELKSVLNASDYFPMLKTLGSADGFALLTGFNPSQVRTTVAADGRSRFSVDNKVDSVSISKLEFDADGNVVISIDAKTSAGAVDPAAAAIYDLDLSKTVTCRIYRKTDLASAGWGDPVAEEEVTVGAGPVTIGIAGEKTAQAYYRAEIIEK